MPRTAQAAFGLVAQAGRYLVVGAVNTLVTLGAILLLSHAAGADYRLANAIGYVLGLACSFVLNRRWTFRSGGAVTPQVLKFLAVFGVCYAAQFGLLVLMAGRAGWSPSFSQVVAMGAYTALGYLLCRVIVYR